MKSGCIGFFDSGIGGLSTLKETMKSVDGEKFLYYADNENMPLGEKSREEILEIVLKGVKFLAENGAKMIVLACNTATGIGAKTIRENAKVPIVGIEPAIKVAIEKCQDGKLLTLTTNSTASSEMFCNLINRFNSNAHILVGPQKELARQIEEHFFDKNVVEKCVREALEPYRSIDVSCIVLGCTHYALVRDIFEKVSADLWRNKTIFVCDGNCGVAKRVKNLLEINCEKREELYVNNSLEIVCAKKNSEKKFFQIFNSLL